MIIKVKKYLKKEDQERLSFLRKFENITQEYVGQEYDLLKNKRKVWINGKPSKQDRFSRFYYFEGRDYSELNLILNDIFHKIGILRSGSSALEGMDKVEEIMRNVVYKINKDENSECYKANQIYKRLSKKYVKHIYEYYLKHEFNSDECCTKWLNAYQSLINHPELQNFSRSIKENYITFNTAFQFVFEYANARKFSANQMTQTEFKHLILDTYALSSGRPYPSFRKDPAHITKGNWIAMSEELIPKNMDIWTKWATDGKEIKKYHPIEFACVAHCVLVQMQAFPDGNHRLARLIANEILIENDIPPVYIAFDKRDEYHAATDKAIESHDLDDLIDIYYNQVTENAKEINTCLDKLLEKQQSKGQEKTL